MFNDDVDDNTKCVVDHLNKLVWYLDVGLCTKDYGTANNDVSSLNKSISLFKRQCLPEMLVF